MNLAIPPQVLVRRGVAVGLQQRLVADGDAIGAPDVAKSADCSSWSQITLVCDCGGAGGDTFTFDLYWYYANSGLWVKDDNVKGVVVTYGTPAAFVVSTAAAAAVYARVTAHTGTGAGNICAEANQ